MRPLVVLGLGLAFLICYHAGRQLSANSVIPPAQTTRRELVDQQTPLRLDQVVAKQHASAPSSSVVLQQPVLEITPPQPPAVSERSSNPLPNIPVDVTIVSFANFGMIDFAVNWILHLRDAIGPSELASRLLMYVVGDDTRAALLRTGLIPEACLRDGTLGAAGLGLAEGQQGFKYESPGFMKLAAQRPRILLAAIEERSSVSAAVLYSDVDAVWRRDPLPTLRPLLPQYDVIGAQDENLICTGFFMFSTRSPRVSSLLRDWEMAISHGKVVNQYAFNDKLKVYSDLRVHRLPHELFPSGLEFFHLGRHKGSALVVHANYFQGQPAKQEKLREAGLWRNGIVPPASLSLEIPEAQRVAAVGGVGDPAANKMDALPVAVAHITIISFANFGMLDFALNWLRHLRAAIGEAQMAASLLMYIVGEETRAKLLASGLIPETCLRDGAMGAVGMDANHAKAGFKYESPGFMKLAAQRPRILMAAIEERSSVSAAVLYSDVDAVWRRDPLPTLRPLLPQYDVIGAQDQNLICTGFFLFSTRNEQVRKLLKHWETAISHGKVVNQYVFNDKLKVYPKLRVNRLPHELFPSGMEFFHLGRHKQSALVVHANYFQGQDVKRGKLIEAGLWVEASVSTSRMLPKQKAEAPPRVDGLLPIPELRTLHASVRNSQLSWKKLNAVIQEARRMNCNVRDGGLLVFGGLQDAVVLSRAVPQQCHVLFIGDEPTAVGNAQAQLAVEGLSNAKVIVVKYGSSYKEWATRLEDAAWLMQGIPDEVGRKQWDVILVDGPFGGGPGRMKPIVWARQVVKVGGSVFIDDLTRPSQMTLPAVEAAYAERYYPKPISIIGGEGNNPGNLGHYRCND